MGELSTKNSDLLFHFFKARANFNRSTINTANQKMRLQSVFLEHECASKYENNASNVRQQLIEALKKANANRGN
jgi:hypothetical protein